MLIHLYIVYCCFRITPKFSSCNKDQIPKLFRIWSFKKKYTDSCYSGTKISIIEDVLSATMESRRQWKGIFKVLKENNCYERDRFQNWCRWVKFAMSKGIFDIWIISNWKQWRHQRLRKNIWSTPNCLKNLDSGLVPGRELSPLRTGSVDREEPKKAIC